MKTKTILDAIVFLLILLFVYAAVFKLLDYESFKLNISVSIGNSLSGAFALGIPLLELSIACLLFTSRFRIVGLYASSILMLGFTFYIGYYVLFNVTQRPCACGGVLTSMGWTDHLIFNLSFTILAALGIYLYRRQNRKEYNPVAIY
jgi:hypothetical protein